MSNRQTLSIDVQRSWISAGSGTTERRFPSRFRHRIAEMSQRSAFLVRCGTGIARLTKEYVKLDLVACYVVAKSLPEIWFSIRTTQAAAVSHIWAAVGNTSIPKWTTVCIGCIEQHIYIVYEQSSTGLAWVHSIRTNLVKHEYNQSNRLPAQQNPLITSLVVPGEHWHVPPTQALNGSTQWLS